MSLNFYLNKTSEKIYDCYTIAKKKIWDSTPNLEESLTTTIVKAPIESLAGKIIEVFGKNPASTTIIRDILKMPSVLLNVYEGNPVGHSQYIYDDSQTWAHNAKIVCKGIIVYPAYTFFGNTAVPPAARAANYFCEIGNRAAIIAGKDRQDEKANDISFGEYFTDNFNYTWIEKSFVGGMPKVFASDLIGQMLAASGISNMIKYGTSVIINPIVKSASGIDILSAANTLMKEGADKYAVAHPGYPQANAWKHIHYPSIWDLKDHFKASNLHSIPKTVLVAFMFDTAIRFTSDMATTYILTTPSRLILDLGGSIVDLYHDTDFSYETFSKAVDMVLVGESENQEHQEL